MERFITFIDETINNLRAQEKQLAEDARKDEANLVRIKINIYDVCRTVYGVCVRMPAKAEMGKEEMQNVGKWQAQARCDIVQELRGDAAVRELYLRKLEAISESWRLSYEKAKINGDVEKLVVEEIKIKAYEDVKKKFLEFCEE